MSTPLSFAERLDLVRRSMKHFDIQAFIIPHEDEHLGEYTAPAD